MIDPGAKEIALADSFTDHLLERLVGDARDRGRERPAEPAVRRHGRVEQDAQAGLGEQLRFRGLVEHLEAGGDIGLEWKLMQQPRAEGVDGLHLQPARRVQRQGEQPPRPRPPDGVGLDVGNSPDRGVEPGIVERGPAAQLVEHPVGHVGGGGLGEGDAEDFRRLDAVEQQADDALRQHMGLAGAGIGRDPGGDGRVRRLDLQSQHRLGNGAGDGHGAHSPPPASSSSLPPTDHSFTRARWS